MNNARLAILLLCALAGCVTTTPAADQAPPPVAETLSLRACFDETGRFARPMEEVAPLVPPPFEPDPYDDAGAFGQVWVLALACDADAPDGREIELRIYLRAIAVHAPDETMPDDANAAMLVLELATTEEWAAERLRAWGHAAAVAGEIAIEVTEGPVRTARAEWGDARLDTTGATPEGVQGADFFRFFLVADGEVTAAIDWRTTEARVRRGSATDEAGNVGLGGHFWGDDYDYELTRTGVLVAG